MATIYDVAREAGVSSSTVSRVINEKKEVNEETRTKVQEAMQKLNYRPNASARTLALHKSYTIGVVSAGLTDPFFSHFVDGIYITADEMGYGALFCENRQQRKTNIDYFQILYGKVDGIIFVGENTVTRSELVRLQDEKYPIALIESNINIPGVIKVNIDNFQGAYNATRYLIQLGHKRIAHITGGRKSFESLDRISGYTQAMQDYGIEADNKLIKEGYFSYSEAYHCAMELMKKPEKFTAIFCANDIMAAAFMHAAMESGFDIPRDFSVIGFDDIKNSDLYIKGMPMLTTIRQPRYEMAAYAVKALISQIHGDEPLDNKVFNTELIIRESTASKL